MTTTTRHLHALRSILACSILSLSAFLLGVPVAFGGTFTFYVDSVTGNDSNDGRSETTPWRSIAKVNTTLLAPGQSVGFQRGRIWRETLLPLSSGIPGTPIVYGAYGTGTLPIISGADQVTKWIDAVPSAQSTLFTASFDTGSSSIASQFSGTVASPGNSLAINTTHAYDGSASMAAISGGASTPSYAFKDVGKQNDLSVTLAFQLDNAFALPSDWSTVTIASLQDHTTGVTTAALVVQRRSPTSYALLYAVKVDNAWSYYDVGSYANLVKSVWYNVMFRWTSGVTTGGGQLWVNGVSYGFTFSKNTSVASSDRLLVGFHNTWTANIPVAASRTYFDRIIVQGPGTSFTVLSAAVPGRPNGVWDHGVLLKPATSLSGVTPSTWYYDSSANRIAVATGSGDLTVEFSTRPYGIALWGKSYVVLEDLQVEKTNGSWQGAIHVDGQSIKSAGVEIRNSVLAFTPGISIYSANNVIVDGNTIYGDPSISVAGITLNQGTAAAQPCSNVTITNNTVHDVEIGLNMPTDKPSNAVATRIAGNTFYNMTNNGLSLNACDGFVIEGNTLHDGGTSTHDTSGIHLDRCTNSSVRFNVVHDWADPAAVGGNGIQIDTGSDNAVVSFNVTYNNAGAGISVVDARNAGIYNNTSYGNSQAVNVGEISLISPVLGSTTATVTNNIGYATKSTAYSIYLDQRTATNGVSITNNDWYKPNGNWFYRGGMGGSALATWKSLSGVGSDLSADPQFTNPQSLDFTLQPNSPCQGVGRFVPAIATLYTGGLVNLGRF